MLSLITTMLLAMIFLLVNPQVGASNYSDDFSRYTDPKLKELDFLGDYEELKANPKTAVIFPIFTQSAYEWGGIHDYYSGKCADCYSVEIQTHYEKLYSNSGNGFRILELLDYQILDDVDVDKNPSVLDDFDTIILLHNEFVTKKEFDAITSHPHVIYLYPNALNSEIRVDYSSNTLTLVKGPSYPSDDIKQGFDWEFDNSEFFYDWDCNDWEFNEIDNGFMLNCYPEKLLTTPNGKYLLQEIKAL